MNIQDFLRHFDLTTNFLYIFVFNFLLNSQNIVIPLELNHSTKLHNQFDDTHLQQKLH